MIWKPIDEVKPYPGALVRIMYGHGAQDNVYRVTQLAYTPRGPGVRIEGVSGPGAALVTPGACVHWSAAAFSHTSRRILVSCQLCPKEAL